MFTEIEILEQRCKETRFSILCAFASALGLHFNGTSFELDKNDYTNTLANGLLGMNVDNSGVKHETTNVVRLDRNGYLYYLGATVINNNGHNCKYVMCPQRLELGYTSVPLKHINTCSLPDPLRLNATSGTTLAYTMRPVLDTNVQDVVHFICWFMSTQKDCTPFQSTHKDQTWAQNLVAQMEKPFMQRNCASKSDVLGDVDKEKYKDVLECLKVPPVVVASSDAAHTVPYGNKVLPICVLICDTPKSVIRRIWGKVMQELSQPDGPPKPVGGAQSHPQAQQDQYKKNDDTPNDSSASASVERMDLKTSTLSFEDFCSAMSNKEADGP